MDNNGAASTKHRQSAVSFRFTKLKFARDHLTIICRQYLTT